MNDHNTDWLNAELRKTGRAVAALSRTKAPASLFERTLEAAAQIKPIRQKLLMLRPITHPLARFAAAAMLMSMVATAQVTDLDTVESVGRKVEYSVVGSKNVDRFEQFMDTVLAKINTDGYTQSEIDAVTGEYNTNPRMIRIRPQKARSQNGV
ncbi:MAG: hypothetical protein WCT04_16190 [Planctomycetota bacterium]